MGARADILRLEILYREGGVYIDTDFECLKPQIFDVLNTAYDFYCGLHPLDCRDLCMNNAIVGSIPEHPIIEACIKQLNLKTSTSTRDEVVLRGPGLFTRMTLQHMNKDHKDMVFPPSFFYPLGVFEMKYGTFGGLPFCEDTLAFIKKKVSKPETAAIHWWDSSWTHPMQRLNERDWCGSVMNINPITVSNGDKL